MARNIYTRILNCFTYICCCIKQNVADEDECDYAYYDPACENDLKGVLNPLELEETEDRKRTEAALTIQTAVRSYLFRRKTEKDRDLESTNKEVVFDSQTTEGYKELEAAVRIQAAVRGFLVRRKIKTDLTSVVEEKNNPTSFVDENHICQIQVRAEQTLDYEKILMAPEMDLRLGGNKAVEFYWNFTDVKVEKRPDIMIMVHHQEFGAHKEVLAYHSQYFKEILVKQCFHRVYSIHHVEFPKVTVNAFDILLEFMYTGELTMTFQEFTEVNVASRLLRMDEALNKCNKLLDVNAPNSRRTFYLYAGATKLGYANIKEDSVKFMAEHFESIVMEKEFLDFETEQIVEILDSDKMTVRSEVVVFLSALKWIRYNFLEREQHIMSVLSCVRFPLMTEEEILACYHPPVLPGVMKIPEVQMLLLDATCYIMTRSEGQEKYFSHLASKPRKKKLDGEILKLWHDTNFRYSFSKLELCDNFSNQLKDLSNFDPEKLAED